MRGAWRRAAPYVAYYRYLQPGMHLLKGGRHARRLVLRRHEAGGVVLPQGTAGGPLCVGQVDEGGDVGEGELRQRQAEAAHPRGGIGRHSLPLLLPQLRGRSRPCGANRGSR